MIFTHLGATTLETAPTQAVAAMRLQGGDRCGKSYLIGLKEGKRNSGQRYPRIVMNRQTAITSRDRHSPDWPSTTQTFGFICHIGKGLFKRRYLFGSQFRPAEPPGSPFS